MSKDKRSFFERLTGTVRMDDESDLQPVVTKPSKKTGGMMSRGNSLRDGDRTSDRGGEGLASWIEKDTEEDGELTVDVYETPDTIVVKSMIAGVRPEDLDVSITRDMVTIRGKREEERVAGDDDYFVRELYWGSFSRTIQLPEEVDVDEADAIEKHGLLILKLPKLDKKRQSKLKVKTA